jgi:hypothetical protein
VFNCQRKLEKINSRTVLAALRGSNAGTVAGQLVRQARREFHLIVSVHEDFLIPIEERLVFVGRDMTQSEKDKIRVKK